MKLKQFWALSLLALTAFAVILAGCNSSGPGHPDSSKPAKSAFNGLPWEAPGIPMVQRLKMFADDADAHPGTTRYLNHLRAEVLRKKLAAATDDAQRNDWQMQLAMELLNAGETQDAIAELAKIEAGLKRTPANFAKAETWLRMQQAVANLRLGEQQNCCANNNLDSCLLPIRGQGIHTSQEGSRKCIQILEDLLRKHPDDLQARWLLNIACMTVGDWPDKVPKQWVIPPKAFKSDYDIKRFVNVAPSTGVNILGVAGGSAVDDFDGDGRIDILVTAIGLRDQMHLFHNNGDGTFSDRTKEAGLEGEVGSLNMITADYDNDGDVDVFILRGGWWGPRGHIPASLVRNNGDGTFTDVTEEAGLLSFHPTQTGVWFDYNNDGLVDLYVGNETYQDDVNPCELYRNNGDGTFTECSAENGVRYEGWVKGVTSADYDHDGRADLYVSVLGAPNVLYHNDGPASPGGSPKGPWKFTDVAARAGVTEPISSFPCLFFDYDNDGWEDLFVSGYTTANIGVLAASYLGLPNPAVKPRLYHNEHDGTFKDVTSSAHAEKGRFGMGINFGDFDNDGWQDFYIGTGNPFFTTLVPNMMFRNAGGKFFQDVTTSADVGDLQKGHGVSIADINDDGQQDIFEEMGGLVSGDTAHSVLFANPGHPGHWLKLRLEGVQTNRLAIGARVKVVVATPHGARDIYSPGGSGASFGANPYRREIGLGDATGIQRVEINWPITGKTQVITGLGMDKFYKIKEGETTAEALPLHPFKWPALVGATPQPMNMN